MTPTQATAAKQPITASQHLNPKSDIEISQSATKRLILDVARDKLGIGPEHLEPYGHYKAKVSMDFIKSLQGKPNGKLFGITEMVEKPPRERPSALRSVPPFRQPRNDARG
jgi:formate--tetrahydrofolate ligase